LIRRAAILAVFSALLPAVPSCGQPSAAPDAGPRSTQPSDRRDGGPHDHPVVRRSRALMSTVYEFVVAEPDSPGLQRAMDDAFAEIARLEGVLSEWRADSEISAVNRAAGRAPVKVGADVLAVVKAGLAASAESEGAFDMTWASLHGVWDFRADPPRIPDRTLIAQRVRKIDYRKVTVDEAASTVGLGEVGMAIGLGGIAKGYALDRAAAILTAAGIRNFVLYGGGQVLVSGRRGGRPWRVGIQNPRGDGYFAHYEMTSGSASTSGDYERFFVLDGVRYHHIIDTRPRSPTRGMPARGLVSVTVIADTGMRADALSTAIFVSGAEKGMELARRAGVEAVLVTDGLETLATDGIRPTLRARPLGDTPLPTN